MIGDYPVFTAETLAILKALQTIIPEKLSNVIIKSDLLTTIQAINEEIKPPNQICNMIEDIIVFAKS